MRTMMILLAASAAMPRAVAMAPRAAAKKDEAEPTKGKAEDKLAPATAGDMEASGAFVEPGIKERIDVDHPAVDNNPRQGQSADANRIDFNDPTKTEEEAVADNLKEQGDR